MDSRRRQRRLILPAALGAALLVALLAGVIAHQAGGPDLARVPAGGDAVPAPDYASAYGTEHDPFVIQNSRSPIVVSSDYRLSPPNEAEPAEAGAGETSPAGNAPAASAPVAYCAAVYQRNDALYRACAASAGPVPVEDRPGQPAAPAQRRAPAQDPAWFDARDYGVAVPSPAATDGDEGPCRKPWRACDR